MPNCFLQAMVFLAELDNFDLATALNLCGVPTDLTPFNLRINRSDLALKHWMQTAFVS